MSIFKTLNGIIKRYGSSVQIVNDEKTVCSKAFIQPLRYKNKIYVGGQFHKLGLLKTDKYLYIGSADNEIKELKSIIKLNNNKYIVKRSEIYYVANTPVYIWAILQPYGSELRDEYESN